MFLFYRSAPNYPQYGTLLWMLDTSSWPLKWCWVAGSVLSTPSTATGLRYPTHFPTSLGQLVSAQSYWPMSVTSGVSLTTDDSDNVYIFGGLVTVNAPSSNPPYAPTPVLEAANQLWRFTPPLSYSSGPTGQWTWLAGSSSMPVPVNTYW